MQIRAKKNGQDRENFFQQNNENVKKGLKKLISNSKRICNSNKNSSVKCKNCFRKRQCSFLLNVTNKLSSASNKLPFNWTPKKEDIWGWASGIGSIPAPERPKTVFEGASRLKGKGANFYDNEVHKVSHQVLKTGMLPQQLDYVDTMIIQVTGNIPKLKLKNAGMAQFSHCYSGPTLNTRLKMSYLKTLLTARQCEQFPEWVILQFL